ncbi:MAG TPA: hypothetical protein VFP86_04245 [bacterium]|nr:hypothetical protein [bacterium]
MDVVVGLLLELHERRRDGVHLELRLEPLGVAAELVRNRERHEPFHRRRLGGEVHLVALHEKLDASRTRMERWG